PDPAAPRSRPALTPSLQESLQANSSSCPPALLPQSSLSCWMVSDTMVMSTPYCATPPPTPPTHRKSGLLRGERMRAKGWCGHHRAIEEREEFAPLQLIKVRSVPASQGVSPGGMQADGKCRATTDGGTRSPASPIAARAPQKATPLRRAA